MSGPHWLSPCSSRVCSSSLQLLRLEVARQGNCLKRALGWVHFPGLSHSGSGSQVLHKGRDSVGSACCALPKSKQLRRPGARRVHSPRWTVRLITPWVPGPRFPRCAVRAPSQACPVFFFWGADLWLRPSWWMSTIQDPRKTWLATGSRLTVWWRMPSLGLRWMPSPSRSGCHLPASLPPAGDGPVRSQLTLLWCLFNSLFCEQVWLCLRLELCRESSLSLSLLSLSL